MEGPPRFGIGEVRVVVGQALVAEVLDAAAQRQVLVEFLAQLQVPQAVGRQGIVDVAAVGHLAADVFGAQLGAEARIGAPAQLAVGEVPGAVAEALAGGAVARIEVGVVEFPAQVRRQVHAAAQLEAADPCPVDVLVVAYLAAAHPAARYADGLDQVADIVLEHRALQRPAIALVVGAQFVGRIGLRLQVGIAVDGEAPAATDRRILRR